MSDTNVKGTRLEIVGAVSLVVTSVVDRLTGDRADQPLLLAVGTQAALRVLGVHSEVIFGEAYWVEVLENKEPVWAGSFGGEKHFWVFTQENELIDLSLSVAYRRKVRAPQEQKATLSPPMIWCSRTPRFCRYEAQGIAEIDPASEKDLRLARQLTTQVEAEMIRLRNSEFKDVSFPNSPILCPNLQVLDDSLMSFQQYDRVLGVRGIPHFSKD